MLVSESQPSVTCLNLGILWDAEQMGTVKGGWSGVLHQTTGG